MAFTLWACKEVGLDPNTGEILQQLITDMSVVCSSPQVFTFDTFIKVFYVEGGNNVCFATMFP